MTRENRLFSVTNSREGQVGEDSTYRYLIHDRDRIFAKHFDNSVRALGFKVLRTPFRSPKVNSICERVIGTIRRECLDWIIPADCIMNTRSRRASSDHHDT